MAREPYEETRIAFLELAFGVELKVEAEIQGWYDPGVLGVEPGHCSPPDGDEEIEVTAVELLAFGKVLDLTELWNIHGDNDLEDAVEEAMGKI